jgi:hypothetical protein
MFSYYIVDINGTIITFSCENNQINNRLEKETGVPEHLQEIQQSYVPEGSMIGTLPVRCFTFFSKDCGRTLLVKIGTCSHRFFVKALEMTTVEEIIYRLQQQVMMDLSSFLLFDNDKQLSSENVAAEIKSSELSLLPPTKDGEIKVFLKTLTGITFPLNVPQSFTIDELKGMICSRDGIPKDQQRLIGLGKCLDDEKTLVDYQIQKGTTLHLVLRLRGGMHHKTTTGTDDGLVSLPEKVDYKTITIIYDGRKIVVQVLLSYSVMAVKLLLEELAPSETMTLCKGDQVLDDDRLLAYYGIMFGDKLVLTIA